MKDELRQRGQLREISPIEITENTFELVGSTWMLVTAGSPDSFNTMTASWGGLGVMWNKRVCFCVIRPTRYTFSFMEKSDCFTLSFFDESYKKALLFCGTKSGRDVNKVKETGLTPVMSGAGIYFAEARLVFGCKKIYTQDIDPGRFLDSFIETNYPQKDYHRLYMGEIVQCLAL